MENVSSFRIVQAGIKYDARPASRAQQGTAPVAGASSRVDEERVLEPKEIQALADNLNETLNRGDSKISVSVDDATGMMVVRITDAAGEIVKQIPPQQLLDADVSVENIIGLLVNDEV